MQIEIPHFVKSRESHFRRAKERHAASEPQVADP